MCIRFDPVPALDT